MKRTGRRSDCPISFALDLLGDAWSLLVMRDLMFTERRTYTDFLRAEERISTNILAERLRRLEAAGLIRRCGTGRGAEYALTTKGLDLLPAMVDLIAWSARYDRHTGAPPAFVTRIRKDRTRLLADLQRQLRARYGL